MKHVLMIGMSHNVGGVETYILNLLRNLDRETIRFYYPKHGTVAMEEELLRLGAVPIAYPSNRHRYFSYRKACDEVFRSGRFDAVYYNTCDILSLDPLVFAKKHGVPVRIIHAHSSGNSVKMDLYHRLLERHCRRTLDRYATHRLACSEIAGDWMFDGRPYRLIRNGISTEQYRFDPAVREDIRRALGLGTERAYCFVGRLAPTKNPLFLLSVFQEILRTAPDSRLFVIGDGELRGDMERQLRQTGVEGRVQFLGVRQDVPRLLNAMDCLLLPSVYEGLPFVLVEAQANGLPCLVSDSVSAQSDITGELTFLPLDAPLPQWARAAGSAALRRPRAQYADVIRSQGFDMRDSAADILEILTGQAADSE